MNSEFMNEKQERANRLIDDCLSRWRLSTNNISVIAENGAIQYTIMCGEEIDLGVIMTISDSQYIAIITETETIEFSEYTKCSVYKDNACILKYTENSDGTKNIEKLEHYKNIKSTVERRLFIALSTCHEAIEDELD